MQPRVQLQVQLRSPRKPRTPDWAYKDLHPASVRLVNVGGPDLAAIAVSSHHVVN